MAEVDRSTFGVFLMVAVPLVALLCGTAVWWIAIRKKPLDAISRELRRQLHARGDFRWRIDGDYDGACYFSLWALQDNTWAFAAMQITSPTKIKIVLYSRGETGGGEGTTYVREGPFSAVELCLKRYVLLYGKN